MLTCQHCLYYYYQILDTWEMKNVESIWIHEGNLYDDSTQSQNSWRLVSTPINDPNKTDFKVEIWFY